MKEIPVETGAYYIFDRGYDFFLQLYRIECAGTFFVVRAKKESTIQGRQMEETNAKSRNIILSNSVELSTTTRNLIRTLFFLLIQWISPL